MSNKKEKFLKKFEGVNSSFALQMDAVKQINDFAKQDLIQNEFYFYKDNYLTIYIYEDDINRVREFGAKELKNNYSYLEKLNDKAVIKLNSFKNKESQFIELLENARDIDAVKKWIKLFSAEAAGATSLGYFAEMFAGYNNYWSDYVNIDKKYFDILTLPEELSFAKEYDFELAKLKLGESDKNSDELAGKWHWLLNNYLTVDIINKEKIEEHLSKITNLEAQKIIKESENFISKTKAKKKEILESLALDEFKIKILRAISSFIVLQDRRKEVAQKTTSLLFKSINKILSFYNFSDEEKKIIFSAALYDWFYDLDSDKLLEESKKASEGLCYPIIGNILLGPDAVIKFEKEREDIDIKQKEIRGSIAFRGNIRGKVCLIIRNDDFPKFRDGDVLVTSMTRPEYIPIMKKASAFITDEGGITCHAAIVAREMRKPCIIGTKIATKVLHDGDLVEVDADKGVVRILEKQE